MIANKKKFYRGVAMLAIFAVILVVMFSPVFDGKNALQYSDELYNSISKDSAYYIPDAIEESEEYTGTEISVTIEMASETEAEQTGALYKEGGASVIVTGAEIAINGDLGRILKAALTDADALYHEETDILEQTYGYGARRVVYNWHKSLSKVEGELTDQEMFDESKVILEAMEKGIEPSYNYADIKPESMSDKAWVVVGSLIFYVFYTVWYGFGLMYLLEGWGLKIGAH